MISIFFSGTVQLVVGLRLLLLARTSKELPEILLGSNLFLLGVLKFSMLLGLHVLDAPVMNVNVWINILYIISHMLFYVTWWRVFRPRSVWAVCLCLAAGFCLTIGFVVQLAMGWDTPAGAWTNWYHVLRIWIAAGAFIWGAIECFTYVYKLRRQISLGLAAPSLALRFGLWGVAQATTFVLALLIFINIEFGSISDTAIHIIWPVINFLNGICWWVSFLTPAFVKQWLDRNCEPA